MFARGPFVVNVSEFDGRSLEQLLARDRPRSTNVAGSIVDSIYAVSNPPILRRLHELGIPFLLDPQAIRFAAPAFLEVESLRELPYAPEKPLGRSATEADLNRLVLRSLKFQESKGVTAYLAPALPFHSPLGPWADIYRRVHELAARYIGSEVAARPLFAYAGPSTSVLRSPYALFSRLSNLPIHGVYVQALALDPRHDGVEKLVSYVNFLRCALEYGIDAVAGRVGAFGLLVSSLGTTGFDSGLAQRESFNLKSLERRRTRNAAGRVKGGRSRRIYLRALMTTVDERVAKSVLNNRTVRSKFACDQEACRFAIEAQITYAKEHFYHSRLQEISLLGAAPTPAMRVEVARRMLQAAAENATHLNRVLVAKGHEPIALDHLGRWQAVLARLTGQRDWRKVS